MTKQPKYKFGDKLVRHCTGTTFIVSEIKIVKSIFSSEFAYYGEGNELGSMENVVNLAKEPKKLYAYQDKEGFVLFFKALPPGLSGKYTRTPDYDFVYPETK